MPLEFDLADEDVCSFNFPTGWGQHDTFTIKCGTARCHTTLSEIIDAQGTVVLVTEDGTELRVVLEQFAASEDDDSGGPSNGLGWIAGAPHDIQPIGIVPNNENAPPPNFPQQSTHSTDVWLGEPQQRESEDAPMPTTDEAPGNVNSKGTEGDGVVAEHHHSNPAPAVPPLTSLLPIAPIGVHPASHAGGNNDSTLSPRGNRRVVWTLRESPVSRCSFQPLWGLCHHTAVWDDVSQRVLAFGGSNGRGEEAELYEYNGDTYQWRRVETTFKPWGRHGHAAVCHEGRMYIFGGVGHNGIPPSRCDPPVVDVNSIYVQGYSRAPSDISVGFLADVWSYTTQTSTWKNVQNTDSALCVRHTASVTRDGRVFLIGGIGLNSRSAETVWEVHLPAKCYSCSNVAVVQTVDIGRNYCGSCRLALRGDEVMPITRTPYQWYAVTCNGPTVARFGHTTVRRDNDLIVFGGAHETKGYLNDVLVLNTQTYAWTVVEMQGDAPQPRCDHAAAVQGRYMFVVGGTGAPQYNKPRTSSASSRSAGSPSGSNNHKKVPVATLTQPRFDDIHILDLHTYTWRCVAVSNNPCGGISQHTTSAMPLRDASMRCRMVVFGGLCDASQRQGEKRQTFLLEGRTKILAPANQDTTAESVPATSKKFEKFVERQEKWLQNVDKRKEQDRESVEAGSLATTVQSSLSNIDPSVISRIATEVRSLKHTLHGFKETLATPTMMETVRSSIRDNVDSAGKYIANMSDALDNPKTSKAALTQKALSNTLHHIESSLKKALEIAGDARVSAEVRDTLKEELEPVVAEFTGIKREISVAFRGMTEATVKHMTAYVRKHEDAMLKSKIKVTENFKASVWKGVFDLGYKLNDKQRKKEEEQWVKLRVQRLQQSFPHVLPLEALESMAADVAKAHGAAERAIELFVGDKKETSVKSKDLVQAAKHASQVLHTGLEKEKSRREEGLTFRQAFFYGKYREYMDAVNAMSKYVKDNVNNFESATTAVKEFHHAAVLFGKHLTHACDKIVVEAAGTMYTRGLEDVQKKRLSAVRHTNQQQGKSTAPAATNADTNNTATKSKKVAGSRASSRSGRAAAAGVKKKGDGDVPSVDDLKAALGLAAAPAAPTPAATN